MLLRYDLRITPEPLTLSYALDFEGNTIAHASFDALTDTFVVEASFGVETVRKNAFDYLLTSDSVRSVPASYVDAIHLTPYLPPYEQSGKVSELATTLARESGADTIAFLTALNHWINRNCRYEIREDGPPVAAGVTLERRCGSCRDFSVLFIDACRYNGLAARFVSGYHGGKPDHDKRFMHAWAEVYLLGAGWRGYDPTHNVAVANRHVAVAAAADPVSATPIAGTFRSTGATATMTADIRIQSFDTAKTKS
jgi:transglutaminase-like putative cysteine protease